MQLHVRHTVRADGDFVDTARLEPGTTWVRQVHGSTVRTVTEPGQHAGAEADALVTVVPGARLAVRTADCAPITLFASTVGAVVHAGWRGLAAGVVEATIASMRDLGAGEIAAAVGPCIHVECYEFGASELDALVERWGPAVRGVTAQQRPALDLPAAACAVLDASGVPNASVAPECTACRSDRYFSWRARRETARFATIAWLAP